MEPLIDIALAASRRKRAAAGFDPANGFLLDLAAEELALRLSAMERHFDQGVELFGADGSVGRQCLATGRIGTLERVEIAGRFAPDIAVESYEDVPLEPHSKNIVLAPLYMHLVNDLPGCLIQIRRALKPDGLLLAAIPGAGTLQELGEVLIETDIALNGGMSPRVMPFADIRSVGSLLQRAGFALPVVDVETYTVRYGSLFSLMRDLRAFGMTNMLIDRSRRPLDRRFFMEAARIYQDRFGDPDGKIRTTFSVIYVCGWAPHESQQKPLKPGSAKMRLADALKAAIDDKPVE
ncbi:methyltransferase domain-containing protein [Rhizobium alvei]|uniref:Methyltransferase domain-containing protein n=1 Tax=Rhizobium alvei TaxID=1132659 RepID=A0ABT8YNB2_9HYPH|nr:methyltransferase domain-containing protein [Rhizobium alvei]MDO6964853.1 methyltransferase domain-containing protein [Rhizobium alvei]